jgi:hypothetical protein
MAKMTLKRLRAMRDSHDGEQQEYRREKPQYQDPLMRDLINQSRAAAKMKRQHKKLGRKFSKGK